VSLAGDDDDVTGAASSSARDIALRRSASRTTFEPLRTPT